MDKNEIIEHLREIAKHAVHTIGEEPFIMSLDDGIAVHEAIEIIQQSQQEPKTVRDKLNSMTDDEFAEWLCHQIFPDYDEDDVINVMRYQSVRNFLKMDIKQAKEGGADMRGQNNDTTD